MVALLLVVVILGISFGQALHSHKSLTKTEQSGEEDSGSLTEKCSICEFYLHKHGKELNLSFPPVYNQPVIQPVTFNSQCYIGNYKFTLQGFTNKGPPFIIA
jgi:hypothetical protein